MERKRKRSKGETRQAILEAAKQYFAGKSGCIDTTVEEPRKDMNYEMALQTLLGLYDEVRKYDGAINRDELLKRDLGMEVVQGQTLSQGNDATTDRTGGVYVLVAKA